MWTVHYTPNIRLFPLIGIAATESPPGTPNATVSERYPTRPNDNVPAAFRTLGDVKNASEVAAWWDSVQTWGGSGGRRAWAAWYASDQTDNSGWHNINNRFVS